MSPEFGHTPEQHDRFSLNRLSTTGLAVIVADCLNSSVLAKILDIATERALDNEFDDEAQNLVVQTLEQQKMVLASDVTFAIQAAMYDMPSAPDPTPRQQ